jgi:hypothetical protein
MYMTLSDKKVKQLAFAVVVNMNLSIEATAVGIDGPIEAGRLLDGWGTRQDARSCTVAIIPKTNAPRVPVGIFGGREMQMRGSEERRIRKMKKLTFNICIALQL